MFVRKKDKTPPAAYTLGGKAVFNPKVFDPNVFNEVTMTGLIVIPLAHTGKDASGAAEVFGTTLGKLYMNPGRVPITNAVFTTFTGAAPALKTVCSAANVNFVAGTNTFEVTCLDAAGNESASLMVTTITTVDAKAPVSFTADGTATYTPN